MYAADKVTVSTRCSAWREGSLYLQNTLPLSSRDNSAMTNTSVSGIKLFPCQAVSSPEQTDDSVSVIGFLSTEAVKELQFREAFLLFDTGGEKRILHSIAASPYDFFVPCQSTAIPRAIKAFQSPSSMYGKLFGINKLQVLNCLPTIDRVESTSL